jgi:hypothetical protein
MTFTSFPPNSNLSLISCNKCLFSPGDIADDNLIIADSISCCLGHLIDQQQITQVCLTLCILLHPSYSSTIALKSLIQFLFLVFIVPKGISNSSEVSFCVNSLKYKYSIILLNFSPRDLTYLPMTIASI